MISDERARAIKEGRAFDIDGLELVYYRAAENIYESLFGMNKLKWTRGKRDSQLVQLLKKYDASKHLIKNLACQMANGGIANFGERELSRIENILSRHPKAQELYKLVEEYKASGVKQVSLDQRGFKSSKYINSMNSARIG